ncbi:MAG: hypothetical protein QHJ73_08060, partial [Armatimonadota bacterium]|nr:hypothetical protein [Armatimonadota bacterium]
PAADAYAIWARVRYPAPENGSLKMVVVSPDEALEQQLVLERASAAGTAWHWERWSAGAGASATTPFRLRFAKGTVVLRVFWGDGLGRADAAPLLDFLCVTNNPDYVPRDTDVPGRLRAPY